MFYAYDNKPSGISNNTPDHNARYRRKKVSRLSLPTGLKPLQPNQPHDGLYSSITSPTQAPLTSPHLETPCVEVPGAPLYQQQSLNADVPQGSGSTHPSYDMQPNDWEALCPSAPYYDVYSSATTHTTEFLYAKRAHHVAPSYPQPTHDTPPIKFSYSSPTSTCLSQSNSALPLGPFNPKPSPQTPVRTQAPLTIHQPRPSRRIPIISLSRLALACEEVDVISQRKARAVQKLHPGSLSDTLSFSDFRQIQIYPERPRPSKHIPSTGPVAWEDDKLGYILQCSCGCMESFTVG